MFSKKWEGLVPMKGEGLLTKRIKVKMNFTKIYFNKGKTLYKFSRLDYISIRM